MWQLETQNPRQNIAFSPGAAASGAVQAGPWEVRMAITFKPTLEHVLGFRHGPRAAEPPPGNVWDYWQGLSPQAPRIARKTIATYFPGLRPSALRCSQIPRSSQTLGFLWPELVPSIELDRRLGLEFEDVPLWAPTDAYPKAYKMTPQAMHAIQPELVDQCGRNFFEAAIDLAAKVGVGRVGVMCSHVPYADAGARYARKLLGISKDDGWLPGKGFGSGAFVHLAFKADGELVSCDYHPAPKVWKRWF